MLFNKKKEISPSPKKRNIFALSSDFGRAISSIDSEIIESWTEAKEYDPLLFLEPKKSFLGIDHQSEKPVYIDESDVVHTLITAPTRAGKGIFFGVKAVESLRAKRGLIIIDPKEDDYLAQIIKEELEKQNRANDFIIWNWNADFGFKTFENDDENESAKKIITMLDLIEVQDEAGASHYRKSERIALKKLMKLFYFSEDLLNFEVEKNLLNFCNFMGYFLEDLSSYFEFQKEKNKPKPNIELLEELGKRYFEPKLFVKNNPFKERDLGTLESLHYSLSEFENINFSENSSISEALKDGKCIYIKSDMLDETALKFLKFIIADIINKARKYKNYTNCTVIADEISFYPTPILSAALATIAGFGVKFILAYQDDGQLTNAYLKSAIKSNCQTKLYYKSSDEKTLDYIEKLGGSELVTKFTINGAERMIRQEQESYLNINKQRALPKSKVGILIHESIPKPFIIDTAPIKVKSKFNWENLNYLIAEIEKNEIKKRFDVFLVKKRKPNEKAENNDDDNDIDLVEAFDI